MNSAQHSNYDIIFHICGGIGFFKKHLFYGIVLGYMIHLHVFSRHDNGISGVDNQLLNGCSSEDSAFKFSVVILT